MLYWARSQTTKIITLGVRRSHLFVLLSVSDTPVNCVYVYTCVCVRVHTKEVMQRKGDSGQLNIDSKLGSYEVITDSDSLIRWMSSFF